MRMLVQFFAIGEMSPPREHTKFCRFNVLPRDRELHYSATMQRSTSSGTRRLYSKYIRSIRKMRRR